MDKNNFSELYSAINDISTNMDNIKHSLDSFSKKYDEIELKKIDNELMEIKKILDSNSICIKNPDQNPKDSLIDSINNKLNKLKDNIDKK